MWYGKGFGVDCCGDVLKYMNYVGIFVQGGVLLVVGDDYGVYFLILLYQFDYIFLVLMILMFYFCNVQEYLDLGLYGWVMLCYFGCVVGFKVLVDMVELSVLVDVDFFCVDICLLIDFVMFFGGFNVRLFIDILGVQVCKQEVLMQDYKIYVVLVYVCVNWFNCVMIDSFCVWLGIIVLGKFYFDVLEVLLELGIDEVFVVEIGLWLFKVFMFWLLELDGVCEFVQGFDEILVVEEKCQMVEYQLKE